jgi:uncharacterized protein with von Willebrand factor type A (vWA) domain
MKIKTILGSIVPFALIIGFAVYLNHLTKKSNLAESPLAEEDVKINWSAGLDKGDKLDAHDKWTTKNYYIVFDGSGSMLESKCSAQEKKIEVAKKAVTEFIQNVPADVNLGLLVFDNAGVSERTPLGIENRDQLIKEVNQVVPGENTPLKSAIHQGVMRLSKQAARQQGYGEYHLVVVTDGEASEGQDPRSIVNGMFTQTPVILHTIGFCIGAEHSLNQVGKSVYQSADSPEQLREGLNEVLAESETFTASAFKESK